MTFTQFVLTMLASFIGTLAAAGFVVFVVRFMDGQQGRPQ